MDKREKSGMTLVEVVIVVIIVLVFISLLLPGCSVNRRLKPSCQNNLKQWALVIKMYAHESSGEFYPAIQRPLDVDYPRLQFSPDLHAVYPEYLTGPAIAVCPDNPRMTVDDIKNSTGEYNIHLPRAEGGATERMDDWYVYWGWAFDQIGAGSEEVVLGADLAHYAGVAGSSVVPLQVQAAIREAHDAYVKSNPMRDVGDAELADGSTLGNGKSNKVFRLREGIERFLVTDINNPRQTAKLQSSTAIMHDLIYVDPATGGVIGNHTPDGANVLFLDGHAEFLRHGTPGFEAVFSDAYLRSLAGALTN